MTRNGARRRPTHPSADFGSLFAGQDTFRLFLFFLTLLTVSRIHAHLGLGALRPAVFLVAGALGYALLNPRVVNWQALFRYWPTKVIAALAIVACLSAAFGISLGATAVFILTEYSKTLVFAALLIAAFRGAADVRLIVTAYVIGAAILVYYALFGFTLSGGDGGMMRLSNLYTYDANDLGLMLLVAVSVNALVDGDRESTWQGFCSACSFSAPVLPWRCPVPEAPSWVGRLWPSRSCGS